MARSTPSQPRSPRSTTTDTKPSRTCTTGRLGSPYAEEEEDEDELIFQIQRLKLPNSNIINVLSERYCTQVLLDNKQKEADGHWLREGERGRPKANIGSHLIKAQDLTKRAGFLEGLEARKIQDLLLSAFDTPSTRRNPSDPSVPIRLQVLAARSHHTLLVKPTPPPSLHGPQASHLCHNPSCFSPSHVILETQAANLARNECRNCINFIVALGKGYFHLPCTHGDQTTGVPSCILPTTTADLVIEQTVTGGMGELKRAQTARMEEKRKAEGEVKTTGGLSKKANGATKPVGRAGAAKQTMRPKFEVVVYQ